MEKTAAIRRLAPPLPPPSIAENLYLVEASRFSLAADEPLSPVRTNNDFLLLSPSQGELAFLLEDASAVCTAGQGLLLLPEATAVLRAVSDCTLDCVTMRGSLADKFLRETAADGVFFPHAAAVANTVSSLLRADEISCPPDGYAATGAAFSLLMQLHGNSAAPGDAAYPALIVAAIGILREEFPFLYGISELSDRLHVTKSHLIRVFTASVGVSPGKYLTSLRISYAKLILRSGEPSLEAVAAAVGFSGADYLGKVFRRETGVTPRRYAAAHASDGGASAGALYL